MIIGIIVFATLLRLGQFNYFYKSCTEPFCRLTIDQIYNSHQFLSMSKLIFLLCCLCLGLTLTAQQPGIQTENDLGVTELIRDVFIKGSCRNVSNITSIGNEILSIGQFDSGGDVISMADGIILSTGDIALAEGPNNNNEASFSHNALSIDLDLEQLATDSLFDVTGIEFDFIPLEERVSFRYVFASEEYCEFVGTSFNDVFGFFVSGPGINGPFDNNAINVAVVANTDDVVSINTVNHLQNEDLYINNATNIDAENCDIGFLPLFENLIEFDGFTVPLVASFNVIPCETYRIRLVISDVGDDRLDSAVFLETNSFDLGEPINVRAEVPGRDDPIAFEGCVDGQFVFTRSPLSDITQEVTVEYIINSDSGATNGTDYSQIPLSVIIPAGESSTTLPISILEDNIIEGPEDIRIELLYDCDCIDPTFTALIIDEADDFSIDLNGIEVCANQPFNISPEISGGVEPFNFIWETGAITDTIQESVANPTQFGVTVTDFCNTSREALADIEIQSIPSANLSGTFNLCETTTTGIPVILEGNPPWGLSYTIDGVEQPPIDNILTSPFILDTPTNGIYRITAFKDAFCDGSAVGSADVESTFLIEAEINTPACFNSTDGSIIVTELDAIAPFTAQWSIETEDNQLLENLREGLYTITITDADGCTLEQTFELDASSDDLVDCAAIYIPNVFSPNNDGVNEIFSVFFAEDSGIQNIISMQIYNRWGNLVFEQNNFLPTNGDIGWRGDYGGTPLTPDVYVYKVNIGFEDGNNLILSGTITILR